jgi:MFS family permease
VTFSTRIRISRLLGGLVYLGRQWRMLHRNARLYVISNTLQAATAGAVGVLYTLYLSALGYQTDFIGAALVVATIGGGLGIIPAGPLVRRLGWRTMLIWSDLIGGFAIALQIVVPTVPVILVTMLGVGASVAIVLVINTPLLTAYSTPHERTALFGINNATNFLAVIVGTLLGGFLPGWFMQREVERSPLLSSVFHPFLVPGLSARSYELALLVSGLLALPSIIPVLMMRDTEVPASQEDELLSEAAPPRESPVPAVVEVNEAAILATGEEKVQGGGKKSHRTLQYSGSRLTRLRKNLAGATGRFSTTQAVLGFGAGLIFPYVNLYFVNTLGTSVRYYGVLSAALSVVVALTSLLAAPLAARFGNMRIAIAVQLLSIPFLLTVGVAPWLWLISLAFLVRGGLMAINNPPLQTFLMEAVDKDDRVLASSVYNVSFQAAWALGAGAGGWLITVLGSHLPFVVAAPFYAISALLLLLWFAPPARDTRLRPGLRKSRPAA